MMMDPARYGRLCEIFDAACREPPEARRAVAAKLCGEDRDLLTGVLAALAEAEAPSRFLEDSPAPASVARLAQAPDKPPLSFGPYDIEGLLGSGGMGRVYVATQRMPRRRVALKTVGDPLSSSERVRLEREAELLGRLEHPGIARVYEAGTLETPLGPRTYVAMELVEGEPLSTRLATTGASRDRWELTRHERDAVLAVVEKAARALHAAHEAGVLHRDIKPQNILVRPSGDPVIVDFGIARDLEGRLENLTLSESLPGTPAYMAPEQIEGRGVLDGRADVWALGVVLYRCLAGRLPFEAPTRAGLFDAIRQQDPTPLRRIAPAVGRDVEAITQMALEKDPDDRYHSALALAEDLRAAQEGRSVCARPVTPLSRFLRWAGRRPLAAAGAAALVLAAVTVAGLVGFLAANWSDLALGREESARSRLEDATERAFFALAERRYAEAEQLFRKLLARDDASSEILAGLSETLILEGDTEGVRKLVAHHAPAFDSTPVLRGFRLRAPADVADGADHGEDPPRTAFGHFMLGLRAVREAESGVREKAALARKHFERAIVASSSPRALYFFGRARALAALPEPDVEAAVDTARLLKQRWPGSTLALFHAALVLPPSHSTEAIELTEEVLRRDPENLAARNNLGNLYFLAGRKQDAIKAFRRVMARAPGYAKAWVNLANALDWAGQGNEAEVAAQKAVGLAPDLVQTHLVLASVLSRKRSWNDAAAAYAAAARITPDDATLQHRLGATLRAGGHLPEAAHAFARAAELAPDDPSHPMDLGTVLLAMKRHDEAIAVLERALALNPGYATALVNLASCQLVMGRLHAAAQAAQRAIDLRPEQAEAWLMLGVALREDGQAERALQAFKEAHSRGTKNGPWPHPTATWIGELESDCARRDELAADIAPAAAAPESLDQKRAADLAAVARVRGRMEEALVLYGRALEDPEALARAPGLLLFNAARTAASRGAPARALTWLTQAVGRLGDPSHDESVARTLRYWLDDPSLEAIREPERLTSLTPEEDVAALRLWRRVRALLGEEKK